MVHNYYQQSGGEDEVFKNEIEILRNNNVEVSIYTISNSDIDNISKVEKIKTGVNAIWSYKQYKNIISILAKHKPDVVHIHNFFPLISPSIFYACSNMKIPVVQTLHNYRLICPAATFLRENKVCEDCLTGSLYNSVKHGCYRESKVQTIPVATMISINRVIKTWKNKVSRYIALTDFAKGKFVQAGIEEQLITVKPNFVIEPSTINDRRDNFLLFVGRISPEKGVGILLNAWSNIKDKKGMKLIIIGDGPDKDKFAKLYEEHEDIIFKGKIDHSKIINYMSRARFLLVPSIWYEGFPMTILEAYSVGTPVIASKIGSLQEVVKDSVTGFHFEKGSIDSLSKVIEEALFYKNYENLVNQTKKEYLNKYTPTVNAKMLMGIYSETIEQYR